MDDPIEQVGVGEAEHARFGIKQDRIGNPREPGKNSVPVLDQRKQNLAIAAVAEHAVEAGEQPTPEQIGKARREQDGGKSIVAAEVDARHHRCRRRPTSTILAV